MSYDLKRRLTRLEKKLSAKLLGGYSRKEVASILGINPRTVWLYTEMGLVKPSIDNPHGKGTTRIYSNNDIERVKLIREISEIGLSLSTTATILNTDGFIDGTSSVTVDTPSVSIVVYRKIEEPNKVEIA